VQDFIVGVLSCLRRKLHYFDLLWICCATNPQQIEVMEFGLYSFTCFFSLINACHFIHDSPLVLARSATAASASVAEPYARNRYIQYDRLTDRQTDLA